MGIAYNFTHMKYPIIMFVLDLIPTIYDHSRPTSLFGNTMFVV